jgi:signal peptidase I
MGLAQITEVPPPGKRKGPVREIVETVLLALIIALLIRTFVVEVYRVQGSSMEATLHSGEQVLVNKFLYRWIREPRQGDIIVFRSPREPDRDFIKRVVAVPGDVVEIREGKVYVNDQLMVEAPGVRPSSDNFGPVRVDPGEVWVLGDNRNNSEDSRWFGPVQIAAIRGMAFMRIWPPVRICLFTRPAEAGADGAARRFLQCP